MFLQTCWCWTLFDVEEVEKDMAMPERMKTAFIFLMMAADQQLAIRHALSSPNSSRRT